MAPPPSEGKKLMIASNIVRTAKEFVRIKERDKIKASALVCAVNPEICAKQ